MKLTAGRSSFVRSRSARDAMLTLYINLPSSALYAPASIAGFGGDYAANLTATDTPAFVHRLTR